MNRKKFITTWIAAALLASCSADWEPDTQPCELLPIRLTANAGESPALPEGTAAPGHTRAASTDGLQNTEFAEGEDLAVYIVDCDGEPTYAATPYRYRAAAAVAGQNALTYYSDATTPSMLYFPADASSNVDVYAFYPYSRFASVADRATSNLDVTVNADQSTAAAYRASDVMMATPVTDHSRFPKTDNAVNLTFRHLMARLVVRLKQGTHAGTTSAITAASLTASTLTIGSVATEATLNMTDGTVTTGSNATAVTVADADLAFYYDNTDAAISATEYAIVLPAQALSSANVVTITTVAGETISGTLPAIDLTAGSSTVLTLTVSDSGIEATRESYGNGGSKTWANYPLLSAATDEDKGKLICTDGHIHAYNADAECTANRVALLFYVGSAGETDATYNHGLAIALTDCANTAEWGGYNTDQSTFTNVSTIDAVNADLAGIAHTNVMKSLSPITSGNKVAGKEAQDYGTAVSGTSGWFLPTAGQWNLFLDYCGYKLTAWASYQHGTAGFNAINAKLTDVGGTALQSDIYWSSSEYNSYLGVLMSFYYWDGVVVAYYPKNDHYRVRAFLAF